MSLSQPPPHLPFFNGLPLVRLLLPAADADEELDEFPCAHLERDERHPFLLRRTLQFAEFGFFEEKLPVAMLVVRDVRSAERILADAGAFEDDLATEERDVRSGKIDVTLAARFDLGAREDDPRLSCLEDLVVIPCAAVLGDQFHDETIAAEGNLALVEEQECI